jgi:ribosome biogenesis protein ENP2
MFSVVEGSGMIFCAMEAPRIGCFFVPQLGTAPRWVPAIEGMTEELEEEQTKMVYDEYKFVTKQEVSELGCSNLVGTKMLKPSMHGFLMHLKLYNKIRVKLELANYAEARKKRIEEEVDGERPVRVENKQIV